MRRIKKIMIHPTITSWGSNLIQVGSSLFILPLLLGFFTTTESSLWLMLNSILALALLADAGFSPTLIKTSSFFLTEVTPLQDAGARSEPKVELNVQGICDLIGTSKRVYNILGAGCLVITYSIGLLTIWNLMELADHKTELWMAFVAMSALCFSTIMGLRWNSLMQGLNLISKLNLFRIATGIVKSLIITILIVNHYSLLSLISVLLIESLVTLIYARYNVIKYLSPYIKDEKYVFKYNSQLFGQIWPSTKRLGLIQIGAYIINYGSILVIAQANDTKLIASFLFTKKVLDLLRSIAQAPVYANIQTIYASISQKDFIRAKKLISFNIFLSLVIVISGSIFICVAGNNVLKLLHIGAFFVNDKIMFIMAMVLLLEMHHSIHATIYLFTNKVPFVIQSLVSGALVLLIGFLSIGYIGIIGVILLQFIIQLACNNWYPVYLNLKILKWPFVQYSRDLVLSPFKMFIKPYHA
jgi:O-antigen/teichoic acid export membrane protein